MDDDSIFTLTVTFWPKDGTLNALKERACELDAMWGGGDEDSTPGDYSVRQASVVILHNAPEELPTFFDGWSVAESWSELADSDTV